MIQLSSVAEGIAALGDSVSVVGGRSETRIDAAGAATEVVLASADGSHHMAVAPRNGAVGVVWSSIDEVVRFAAVSAASVPGPVRNVGCAAQVEVPAIAAVPDGFLVAAPRPEGGHDAFYNQVYPKIRITHVSQP